MNITTPVSVGPCSAVPDCYFSDLKRGAAFRIPTSDDDVIYIKTSDDMAWDLTDCCAQGLAGGLVVNPVGLHIEWYYVWPKGTHDYETETPDNESS